MKKIALMMAFLISAGMLAGCGENNSSDEKSSSSSQVQEKDNSDEASSSSDSQSADIEFERGTVENGVYTSSFADIKFTAPGGWEFANDEYIANMMNISLDVTGNGDDLTKAMLEQTSIYDAMCTEQSTGKNILILFENIAKQVPDPSGFTVEDYMDNVENQFDSLENLTYTDKSDREQITINGEDYTKKAFHVKYEDMDYETEQIYYARKVGDFMLVIIATSGTSSEDMSVYEENFEN
ncbi:MAG: hypothetical protein ACI4JB_07245 [Porcipelethomonas sp.]